MNHCMGNSEISLISWSNYREGVTARSASHRLTGPWWQKCKYCSDPKKLMCGKICSGEGKEKFKYFCHFDKTKITYNHQPPVHQISSGENNNLIVHMPV